MATRKRWLREGGGDRSKGVGHKRQSHHKPRVHHWNHRNLSMWRKVHHFQMVNYADWFTFNRCNAPRSQMWRVKTVRCHFDRSRCDRGARHIHFFTTWWNLNCLAFSNNFTPFNQKLTPAQAVHCSIQLQPIIISYQNATGTAHLTT